MPSQHQEHHPVPAHTTCARCLVFPPLRQHPEAIDISQHLSQAQDQAAQTFDGIRCMTKGRSAHGRGAMSARSDAGIRSWFNAQGLAGQFKYMFRRQCAFESGPCAYYLQGCLLLVECRAKNRKFVFWRRTKRPFIQPFPHFAPGARYRNTIHFTLQANAA